MKKSVTIVAGAVAALGMGGTSAVADAGAQGKAVNSPGIVAGNVIQVPVHVPVNACGNSVNVVGLFNPTMGNKCVND
ncbi:chaplin [Streptomyces sp. NPDC017988]|uniref:chaplin n=1 Tax=Streptomyces sp. NPDC017988 TaxID=3365025 RepID=UPI0037B00F02